MNNFHIKKLPFITFVLLQSIFSIGQSPTLHSKNGSSATEKKVIASIYRLREFKQEAAYVESHSKGKRHLSFVLYQKPSLQSRYYWVKVWEDNGWCYVTHFNLYVYTNPFTVKFLDTVNDEVISLENWRKQRKREKHTITVLSPD